YGRRASREIADILHGELYQARQWRGGDYADSIAVLCREWVTRRNGRIVVLTTNYDQYLEEAFYQTAGTTEPDGLVGSFTLDRESGKALRSLRKPVSIMHIHGVVLREPVAGRLDQIVLDDGDYFRTENDTADLLTSLFSRNDVLILGSSLEDAPLLRALWNTRRGKHRRWAVYPRQNLATGPGAYRRREYNDMIYTVRERTSDFRLDVIAPDFFCQAAQFVREVCVALCHSANDQQYDLANFTHEYNRRLNEWWRSWYKSRRANQVAAHRADHDVLAAEIEQVRTLLGTNERLKLELWLRWRPSRRNRVLKLWASSTVTWQDPAMQHEVPIEAGSPDPAVQAFCAGAAQLHTVGTSHDRWRRYLAVPLRNGERAHSIQVGVFTLSSMDEHSTSLDEQNPRLIWVVERLSATAKNLIGSEYHHGI
ncbi:MAG TPA: SIR2 family protein, partial [Pseudonocardiaceae bacterium]|nr:SIR2 family protein [Pseudonocardiaceae bacterium]